MSLKWKREQGIALGDGAKISLANCVPAEFSGISTKFRKVKLVEYSSEELVELPS